MNSNMNNNTYYILYDSESPVFMATDRNRAFNYLKITCNVRQEYHESVSVKYNHMIDTYDPCEYIKLHMIVCDNFGKCINCVVYTYERVNDTIVGDRKN